MIDTISCFRQVDALPDQLFDGGAVTTRFDDRVKIVRLWRNPKEGQYAPRVTYWRNALGNESRSLLEDEQSEELPEQMGDAGLLKLEFSVAKLAECSLLVNPSGSEIEAALNRASETARVFVSAGFDVREWRCQRVDYTWMWDVGEFLSAYMSVLAQLRISNWSRHPYDMSEGVVWKTSGTRGRWVKFYNKSKELGELRGGVLRYEVSNYRESVRYMAERWFGCDRTVGELVQPVRAVYVMSYFWDKLGLAGAEGYGTEELLERRLRDAFGERVAQAMYVLQMHRKYGSAAYQSPLGLVSRSMYYRYRRELAELGVMTSIDDDATINVEYLDALGLPVREVVREFVSDENLEDLRGAVRTPTNKNLWKNIRAGLGLPNAPGVDYFSEEIRGAVQ